MLAGEGLGGVLQALLAVAKVDGSRECPAYAPVGDGFLRSTCLTLSQRRIWHCDWMSWIRVLRMKKMNTGAARGIEYGLYGLTVISAMQWMYSTVNDRYVCTMYNDMSLFPVLATSSGSTKILDLFDDMPLYSSSQAGLIQAIVQTRLSQRRLF